MLAKQERWLFWKQTKQQNGQCGQLLLPGRFYLGQSSLWGDFKDSMAFMGSPRSVRHFGKVERDSWVCLIFSEGELWWFIIPTQEQKAFMWGVSGFWSISLSQCWKRKDTVDIWKCWGSWKPAEGSLLGSGSGFQGKRWLAATTEQHGWDFQVLRAKAWGRAWEQEPGWQTASACSYKILPVCCHCRCAWSEMASPFEIQFCCVWYPLFQSR